jgi:hypothetical protein
MKKDIIGIFIIMQFFFIIFPFSIIAENDFEDIPIKTKNCQIELDGLFVNAFHFLYRKTHGENNYSIVISIMKFKDADVSINNGEWNEQGCGILFVYRYNGIYNNNYNKDTISINGKALYLHLNIE